MKLAYIFAMFLLIKYACGETTFSDDGQQILLGSSESNITNQTNTTQQTINNTRNSICNNDINVINTTILIFSLLLLTFSFGIVILQLKNDKPSPYIIVGGVILSMVGFSLLLFGNYLIGAIYQVTC